MDTNEVLKSGLIADRYEIIELLGRGGMSVVYKARHQLMGRVVAIKMLHSKLLDNQTSIKRFHQEAQAASQLSHPNLITVFDFGVVPGGIPYLVLDFVDGPSLSTILDEDANVDVARAVPIFVQVCNGLGHAHKKGVLHRDLKPSNIMLTVSDDDNRDFAKVVDFGIATFLSDANAKLTQTGEFCGSVSYMSPEHCRGKTLDQRSDVYSMGCVMYETLIGLPPFTGMNVLEVLQMHINDKPKSFEELRPDLAIPPALEAVVNKALAKDADQRHQSMEELKGELQMLMMLSQGGNSGEFKQMMSGSHPAMPPMPAPPAPARGVQEFTKPQLDPALQSNQSAPAPPPSQTGGQPAWMNQQSAWSNEAAQPGSPNHDQYPSQPGFQTQGGPPHPSQPGFQSQGGPPYPSQPGFQTQGGPQYPSQPGFQTQGGPQYPSQPGFQTQGGPQYPSQPGFQTQGGPQYPSQPGFPTQGGPQYPSQPGFQTHGGQPNPPQSGYQTQNPDGPQRQSGAYAAFGQPQPPVDVDSNIVEATPVSSPSSNARDLRMMVSRSQDTESHRKGGLGLPVIVGVAVLIFAATGGGLHYFNQANHKPAESIPVASLPAVSTSAPPAEEIPAAAPAQAGDEETWKKMMDDGAKAYSDGEFEESEKQYKAALSEAEKFGKSDKRYVTSLKRVADIYYVQGKDKEAEAIDKDVEARATTNAAPAPEVEEKSPTKKVETSDRLAKIALDCHKNGQCDTAEVMLRRAVDIAEDAFGVNSPQAKARREDIASFYMSMGDYDKAQPYLKRVLSKKAKKKK